jgi:hypothetical protein
MRSMADDVTFLRLPLGLDALPASIQRFCDPKGPTPMRVMAAKGLVPVRGHEQVLMLAQLAADENTDVREAARRSLLGMPPGVRHPSCDAALPNGVLDLLAELFENDMEAQVRIAANGATHHTTVERLARGASEQLAERIAVNETLLIAWPGIIEALYKNRNTRMSTADRLIELAARNNLELPNIPAYKEHAEALQGQLIPEPTDEPLPQDQVFNQALAEASDSDDEEVFEEDKQTGAQVLRKKFKPLSMQIADMGKAEKIRLAMVGNKAARALLVRDNNRQVAYAAVSSPQMTVQEASELAKAKDVSEETLRYVSNKKDWVKSADVKHNLVFNPKCPVGISMRFLGHLRADELRQLARSRNVPAQIRSLAAAKVAQKSKNE